MNEQRIVYQFSNPNIKNNHFKVIGMQKDSLSDQELNFKKRARRRLVGAIALVLLMIIVLPMLLKDRASSQQQEKIIITLPGEQQTVTPAAPSDFDSSIVPTEPANPVSVVESNVPTADSEAGAKPEKETPAPANDMPAKAAQVKPIESKPVEEKKHHFYVQIGVFSDEANVKQLQGKLGDLGYKSQTEKITTDKGQKIRLKTQIFSDRNEAAIALQNIKDAGLTGMVVSQ
jgi:DedD protein